MVKVLIGGIAGGVAMFIVSFIFWATPLDRIGISRIAEQPSANLQSALAANLPGTGYYIVPNADTSAGTVLYGKGPVASVNYNSGGYSTADTGVMIGGFIQQVIVSLMIAFSLYAVAGRVTDFASRARLVIGFSAAACVMILLGDPIWMHGDWRFAIYALIGNLAMLVASGLVIAKWFLPTSRP